MLQFSDPNKPYILYTDASNNAYSGILCQPVDNDWNIRPVAYFSGTFTAQNKSWCTTENEAYAVLKSVQCFDYYLRGIKCTLHCDHKHLEPFPTRGMKKANWTDGWCCFKSMTSHLSTWGEKTTSLQMLSSDFVQ